MFLLGLLARRCLLLRGENGEILRLRLLGLNIIGFHGNLAVDRIDLGNGGRGAQCGFQCGQ